MPPCLVRLWLIAWNTMRKPEKLAELFPVAHFHDFRFEILHSCVRTAALAALPCACRSFHAGQ